MDLLGPVLLLGRAQVATLVATTCDFAVGGLLSMEVGWNAGAATVPGAGTGAIVHFALCRFWVFPWARDRQLLRMSRYFIVSCTGLVLNVGGMVFLSNWNFISARTLVSLSVALLFNFPLHRYFVFQVADRADGVPDRLRRRKASRRAGRVRSGD